MDWTITTAPTHEPLSLNQVKRHLRIETTDTEPDALLRGYIGAARQWCEKYAGLAFLRQTVQVRMDEFADDLIVPVGPLLGVSGYTFLDAAGATQTLATTVYEADVTHAPGKIVLAYGQTWPTTRGHHHDVRLTYFAGHAATWTRSGANLSVSGALLTVNDPVQLYNVGGALPAAVTANTQYYVKTVAGATVTLSLTEGGEAIVLADDGTGTHYIDALPAHLRDGMLLKLTDLYSNRGDVDSVPSRAIRDLLGIDRMVTL